MKEFSLLLFWWFCSAALRSFVEYFIFHVSARFGSVSLWFGSAFGCRKSWPYAPLHPYPSSPSPTIACFHQCHHYCPLINTFRAIFNKICTVAVLRFLYSLRYCSSWFPQLSFQTQDASRKVCLFWKTFRLFVTLSTESTKVSQNIIYTWVFCTSFNPKSFEFRAFKWEIFRNFFKFLRPAKAFN